jgi:hypothetical protein
MAAFIAGTIFGAGTAGLGYIIYYVIRAEQKGMGI